MFVVSECSTANWFTDRESQYPSGLFIDINTQISLRQTQHIEKMFVCVCVYVNVV